MAFYEFAWQLAIRLPGQLDAVALPGCSGESGTR
jgi:hypothetical protein